MAELISRPGPWVRARPPRHATTIAADRLYPAGATCVIGYQSVVSVPAPCRSRHAPGAEGPAPREHTHAPPRPGRPRYQVALASRRPYSRTGTGQWVGHGR